MPEIPVPSVPSTPPPSPPRSQPTRTNQGEEEASQPDATSRLRHFDHSDSESSDEDDGVVDPVGISGSSFDMHIREKRPDSHSFNLVDDEEEPPVFNPDTDTAAPAVAIAVPEFPDGVTISDIPTRAQIIERKFIVTKLKELLFKLKLFVIGSSK